jgi:hypothetical protein
MLVLVFVSFAGLVLGNPAFVGSVDSAAGGGCASGCGVVDVVNVDGDVSLSEGENWVCWNPHSTGFTARSVWTASFGGEVCLSLGTVAGEAGHVACGAWWTAGFRSGVRVPLCAGGLDRFCVCFRACVVAAVCGAGGEWLRFALAFAVKRGDGGVVYTELDFWDSAAVMVRASGDVRFGGDVVFRGGDVVEFKVGQAVVGLWRSYSLDLSGMFERAWGIRQGDLLESVYVVVEAEGCVSAGLKVDDFWVTRLSQCSSA